MNNKQEIVIVGAGGFGREVLTLLKACNKVDSKFSVLGFVDDGVAAGSKIHGIEVLGGINYLHEMTKKPSLVLGIGDPKAKKNIVGQLVDFQFITLIHPSVTIPKHANVRIGEGVLICEGNIVTCDITIHDFVTLNLSCTIGHDTTINKFTSCMPGVNISGEVVVEEGVYIGTGATVINQVMIGKHTIIGAGAVVSKDIPANCTAVGIPAKPIKFNSDHE